MDPRCERSMQVASLQKQRIATEIIASNPSNDRFISLKHAPIDLEHANVGKQVASTIHSTSRPIAKIDR